MPDIIDRANEAADTFLDAALKTRKNLAIKVPRGIGLCLCCGKDVDSGKRWCDAKCRDEWEREIK